MRPLPFPVKAWFDFFVVLFFSIDKDNTTKLIPYPLELDLHNGNAIFAVAIVKTKNFRPSFLPAWMGMNFNLVGYRFLTTWKKSEGKTMRGLKIIMSQTNQKIMKIVGDKITQYKFNYNPITIKKEDCFVSIKGNGINIKLKIHEDSSQVPLPSTSIFENWQGARKFAGPLLYTFEINEDKKQLSITEGTRKNWTPKPIEVINCELDFLKQDSIAGLNPMLSAAFMVKEIPYSWKKAVINSF